MKKLALTLMSLMMALAFCMPVAAEEGAEGAEGAEGGVPSAMDMPQMQEAREMPSMRGMMDNPPMHKSCRTPEFFIRHSDDLDLTDKQLETLRKMALALKKEMILKGAAVKVLELDLSELVTQADFIQYDALAKLGEVEKARTELRSAVIKSSAKARDVLAPEQIEKLKQLGLRLSMPACGSGMPMKAAGPMDEGKKMMMEKMRQKMMNEEMP